MRPAVILSIFVCASLAAQKNPEPAPAPAPAGSGTPRIDAAARRNENVPLYRIDNDVIKDANVRLGSHYTIVPEAPVELNHYATEHGRPAGAAIVLRRSAPADGWHGELFGSHQNSVFNARTYFQVGGVKPSRQNAYGGRFMGPLGKLARFAANASQRKIRGMVNGNVLVPLLSERAPLTTDPAARAIVSSFLAAYPAEAPNRTDFDPRALNTNAPQRIDETLADFRLEPATGARGRLTLFHAMSRQRVDAFQLVAGQNPDTDIHTHRSQIGYVYAVSPETEVAAGFAFNRVKSALLPEPNAVGPKVRFGFQIQELGPDSQFPIDRAQNSFRGGVVVSRSVSGGAHLLTWGGDTTRFQLNGIETNNNRGFFNFTNNWGRSALENMRLGLPTTYEATVGEMARGFRNWGANFFVADKWKLGPRLQIYYGLRYGLDSAPVEVNGRNRIPYGCDCNNFSPRFALAYRAGAGIVARASYTMSYGQIQPVTYQQVRYNPPHAHYVQVQNPSLANPLGGIDLSDPNVRTSPTLLAPGLVAPYAHQYSFTVERGFSGKYMVRAGYLGSRTLKLLYPFVMNRADPVPGVDSTTANVDARRPDRRYYEVKHIVNGGMAYLDAAQASLEMPLRSGFTLLATYTFGKALDEGADYASTAANADVSGARNQWQYEAFRDRKGLSNFDSTHAVLVACSWQVPAFVQGHGWLGSLGRGWQLSGSGLMKSGTPLTLYIGSDAPGFGNVDGGASDRPNILDPSILGKTLSDPDTSARLLTRDRFSFMTAEQHRGSLPRGSFRKAGIANFNAAVTKQWRFDGSREWTVLLRGEAFNLTNHAQFDEPQRNLSAPPFGKITNTLNDGRVLQLGLRLIL